MPANTKMRTLATTDSCMISSICSFSALKYIYVRTVFTTRSLVVTIGLYSDSRLTSEWLRSQQWLSRASSILILALLILIWVEHIFIYILRRFGDSSLDCSREKNLDSFRTYISQLSQQERKHRETQTKVCVYVLHKA
jgi:hypothetical protein